MGVKERKAYRKKKRRALGIAEGLAAKSKGSAKQLPTLASLTSVIT
jgi:hypothetical protein